MVQARHDLSLHRLHHAWTFPGFLHRRVAPCNETAKKLAANSASYGDMAVPSFLFCPNSEATMALLMNHMRVCLLLLSISHGLGLSVKSSAFLGHSLVDPSSTTRSTLTNDVPTGSSRCNLLVMRKQKASDRRTRRRQRGILTQEEVGPLTVTDSPMKVVGPWRGKAIQPNIVVGSSSSTTKTGGRGRSRKRSTLYNSLSFYHSKFLTLLTHEYQVEVSQTRVGLDDTLDVARIFFLCRESFIKPCTPCNRSNETAKSHPFISLLVTHYPPGRRSAE